MTPKITKPLRYFIPAVSCAVFLTACSKKTAGPMSMQRPPAEVSVLTVTSRTVKITTELPGRINSVREAQVRARATGILLKRLFEEGSNVKDGDVLFQIDPAPLQASYNSAKAALARAEAAAQESKATASRYKELVKINAVSKQAYDEAIAAEAQNDAEVLAQKAAVETAGLNLGYAQVTAPISGRIGKALVTEGALVSATEATQLATIRQLDPIYFDFTESAANVLRLKRALGNGSLSSGSEEAQITLILEDGSTYPHPGKVLFSDVSVDPTTGMITLRAEVPNPDNILLPGMFARAQIVQEIKTNAVTIPERTATRGIGGATTVLVVNSDNKVELRPIQVETTVDQDLVVSSGLKAGEKIIIEGSQKAPPGSTVKPVPFISENTAQAKAE
jgi:membrane fusion protein (multidrug efflux system)